MGTIWRAVSIFAVAAVTVSAAACGGGSSSGGAPPVPFTQPDVAVRDVRLRGMGLTGGALDLEMRVYNPNGYDLQSPRVGYHILLDTVLVASGFTDLSVVVPERDSAVVRVPASFSYVGIGRAGRALLATGAAPYRVRGRITVGTPYGRLSFPYDRAGQVATLPR